jgi:hypothetical protein
MGQLVFQATLGGAINLSGPNTASTVTFTLPSADGSTGQVIQTNGAGLLSLGNVALGSAVSGTLPVANGGTGVTSPGTSGNVLTSNGTAWVSAAPVGTVGPLVYNYNTISANITVPSGQNGLSVGPMTINSGYSVTVTTGQRWVVL